jgi:hypothetical protein
MAIEPAITAYGEKHPQAPYFEIGIRQFDTKRDSWNATAWQIGIISHTTQIFPATAAEAGTQSWLQ